MTHIIYTFILIATIFHNCFAQKRVDTLHVTEDSLVINHFKKSVILTQTFIVNRINIGYRYHLYSAKTHYVSPIINKTKKEIGAASTYIINADGSEKLISTIPFVNGNKEGLLRNFHNNGNKKCECNYHLNKLNGVSKMYHENGNIQSILNYVNGKIEGEATYYNDKEELISKNNFKNNKLHGKQEYMEYDSNGKVSRIITKTFNKGNLVDTP